MSYCEGYSGAPRHYHALLLIFCEVHDAAVHLVLPHLLDAMQQGAVTLIFQNHKTAASHLKS